MNIQENSVVTVQYRLTGSTDGGPEEKIESTTEENPFIFLFGAGNMLEEFEINLKGKAAGDVFDFRITSEKAYGIYNQEMVAEIPRSSFEIDGKFDSERVKEGEEVPMLDDDGQQIHGLVTSVNEQVVIMDFNHPLAGYDLHFVGNVAHLRVATEEELSHGHVHGQGGHHH